MSLRDEYIAWLPDHGVDGAIRDYVTGPIKDLLSNFEARTRNASLTKIDNLKQTKIETQNIYDTGNFHLDRHKNWLEKFMAFLDDEILKIGNNETNPPHSQNNQRKDMSNQTIFFGAPGTGKSYHVNDLLEKRYFLLQSAEVKKDSFVVSNFCKKNYDQYMNTPIPRILGYDVYKIKNIDDLQNAYKKLKASQDHSISDYCSGLNSYISFVQSKKNAKIFRTTFHPDYDYAQFVGSYKPIKTSPKQEVFGKKTLLEKLIQAKETLGSYPLQKFSVSFYNSFESLSPQERKSIVLDAGFDESMNTELGKGIAIGRYLEEQPKTTPITYTFVPQVFARAYTAAWKNYLTDNKEDVFLVIEEINRGNCAQIFGDIFQLLDRIDEGSAKGFSRYSIDADYDFAKFIEDELKDTGKWDQYKSDIGDGKLKLPPNLSILATMNTSDQSLFPMDSAFKRRFDWEYVPIRYEAEKDKNGEKKDKNWNADKFQVVVDDNFAFNWLHFLKKVNADIYKVTESEDKQMGEFFIKPKSGNLTITRDEFRSKVLFYLWDSVYKDEVDRKVVFRFDHNGTDVTFQRLFADDFSAILKKMLQNLDEAYNSDEFKGFKILDQEKESENQ